MSRIVGSRIIAIIVLSLYISLITACEAPVKQETAPKQAAVEAKPAPAKTKPAPAEPKVAKAAPKKAKPAAIQKPKVQVAQKPKAKVTHKAVTSDDFMGDYSGLLKKADASQSDIVAQVIARGNGVYETHILDAFDKRIEPIAVMEGNLSEGEVIYGRNARISRGSLVGKLDEPLSGVYVMKKVERLSPTLGKKPPKGAIVLFDGSNTDSWLGFDRKTKATKPCGWKLVEDDAMEIVPGSGWAKTKKNFGDFQLHLEFRTPLKPTATGQARGNSGVYFQGRYEVQVLDSYGLTGEDNECGGIYKIAKPRVNMCAPPLQWQTYDVTFRAPKFDKKGDKISDASITVIHNGVTIHKNLVLPTPTHVAPFDEDPGKGPLVLQDHGNPVRYRNIWLKEPRSKK
jgi:hypothetical protein